jgi:MscS family membrane protein
MKVFANFGTLLAAGNPATTQGSKPPGFHQLIQYLRLGQTFQQTTWKEWAWLLLTIFVGVVAGKIAQYVIDASANRLNRRGWTLEALMLESLDGPAQLAAISAGISAGILPILAVSSVPIQAAIIAALKLLLVIIVGWFLYNVVEVITAALSKLTARTDSKLDDQIIPLVRKTLRLFLVVLVVLFGAQYAFGANITAWLAGLGIAGLAVSLAAQDSLKNLFGSVTVLLDRPFQVGDRVVIDGHDGPVQEIGFRSTKLRKLSGEIVTIPNSKVVDASVVNVQRRPNIPRIFSLTITYDTPPDKVEQAVLIVRDILAEPEMVAGFDMEKLPPRVYFDALNADSLNIKVFYWFVPASDGWGYNEHAQKFNLKVLRAFNEAGIEFAFPTQTLFLAQDNNRPFTFPRNNGNGFLDAEEAEGSQKN